MALRLPTAISRWLGRRRALSTARFERDLERIRADTHLSKYKARSDIEWDMKWAHEDQRHTLRDEFLIALWSTPAVLLFIPATRPGAIEALEALKAFAPEAPTAYVAGWAVILTAVFGVKQLVGLFMPTRFATLAKTLGSLPPDVPPEAASYAPETPTQPDKD